MKNLPFVKMQGAGNDFILIDNREGAVPPDEKVGLVQSICPRAVAVGADGVIFLEGDEELDFRWDFYNADGSSAEMCGNGARCVAVFAQSVGAAPGEMTFRTLAGPIRAAVSPLGARVQLTESELPAAFGPLSVGDRSVEGWFINTGVPHVVLLVDDLATVDLPALGAGIRYHEHFAPNGTNVNFMCRAADGIAIRTYERGVEGETLACGTGAAGCAVTSAVALQLTSPVQVQTASGDILRIAFQLTDDGVRDLWLEGPARMVYTGVLSPNA